MHVSTLSWLCEAATTTYSSVRSTFLSFVASWQCFLVRPALEDRPPTYRCPTSLRLGEGSGSATAASRP